MRGIVPRKLYSHRLFGQPVVTHDRTIVRIRIKLSAFVRRITAEEPLMKTMLLAGLNLSGGPHSTFESASTRLTTHQLPTTERPAKEK
jgi:hypothetical protein